MAFNDMNICTINSLEPLETRVYACELEIGDVTHFGTVEWVERLDNGKTLVTYKYPGTSATYKDLTAIHVANRPE